MGTYHPLSSINMTLAISSANKAITADVTGPSRVRTQGNDWFLQKLQHQRNFSTSYSEATYVALGGYQQQSTKQTVYPDFQGLSFTGVYNLRPNQSWLFTFSTKPKLVKRGFWSLSVYGCDQYLIPNSIDRFQIGDRTYNLTYEDYEHIYWPQVNASRNGPFQILVQPATLIPPANWTSNWLPADTRLSLLLRWYVPEPVMTSGSYAYSKFENITAII